MEIEIKYNVRKERNAIIEIIKSSGGAYKRAVRETDTYYNVNGRDSIKTKECLRARESSEGFSEITYKPGTIELDNKHFAKKETNLRVFNLQEAKELLVLLGNTIIVVVEKSREYYQLDKCTICLDYVENVGSFVEIEMESDDKQKALTEIRKCATILGLGDQDVEVMPYRDLVVAHSQKNKLLEDKK